MNPPSSPKQAMRRPAGDEAIYSPQHKIRLVTAASLFDGHDASINIMRRMLQSTGCEVIHLGHNRSVHDVVLTALQEDVQAIGLSILSGAHMTIFDRIMKLLKENKAERIVVFGGGIIPEADKVSLKAMGVGEIFTPGTPTTEIISWLQNAVTARA